MKLNLYLAKTFQSVTFVLLTFMALVYFGVLLLLALAVLWYTVKILGIFGLPILIRVPAGIAVLAFLGLKISRMPALYELIFNIGMGLVNYGKEQIHRFDPLIETEKGPTEKSAA
jgi:hypothetical protein